MIDTQPATVQAVGRRAVADLQPNPHNPRGPVDSSTIGELADSIMEQGILQPLLITPEGTVVAGHRRLAAAILVGLADVPVLERAFTQQEQLEIMLVENIQREDLTPIQEARGYQQLIDTGATRADVARRLGITGARVQMTLAILKLDPAVQDLYAQAGMPVRFASQLARVTDPRKQLRFANIAARRQMPAERLEELIKRSLGEEPIAPRAAPSQDDVAGPNGLSPTRIQLLDQLRSEAETTISFDDLAQALEATCCWCGMESMPEVCGNCPMPQLVARIVAVA